MFLLQEVMSNTGQEEHDMPRSGNIANISCADDTQVISSEQIAIEDCIGDDVANTEQTSM